MEFATVVKYLCILLIACQSLAVPTNKMRGPRGLSDEEHYDQDTNEHNQKFDAEAFLGKEEAAEYKALSPQESRRRLRIICEKIDADKDGYITHDELKNWVEHVSHRSISDNAGMRFPHHDKDGDGKISFEEYKQTTYGEIEDEHAEYDPHRKLSYKQTLEREFKRFKVADKNGDNHLDDNEFKAFLHPDEFAHMKGVVIDEAFEDMDKDKDGHITVNEYIEDIWPLIDRKENEAEPDWVANEKEQFHNHRDQDGDSKLNKRELGNWISPEGFEHAEAEAKHLIFNADSDKDKKLTMDEVISNHELFIGSQATEFGDYLRRHDEF